MIKIKKSLRGKYQLGKLYKNITFGQPFFFRSREQIIK